MWRKKHPRAKSKEKANGSRVQSLRFDKKKFSRSQAISWAKSHGFKYGDVEETPNQWRLRQFDPDKCSRSGGIKEFTSGIEAYICPVKNKEESIELDVLDLNNIYLSLEELPTLFGIYDKLKARGDGQGQGGDTHGDGEADICVYQNYGYKMEHEKEVPCTEVKCSGYGSPMIGKNKKSDTSIEETEEKLNEIPSALYKSERHTHMDLLGNMEVVSKSNDRKIIAGYASLAVVDTEDEYIPVEVLKEGLSTLMKDKSYSNIMIVHKNIQIGKILEEFNGLKTHVDDKGLYIVAEIRDDLEIAKQTWKQIEDGEIRGFSIGGEIIDDHEECDDNKCINVIDKINLFEVSVCSHPVNKDSGFEIVNKSYVNEMLENCEDRMKKEMKKTPEVKEKAEDKDNEPETTEEIKEEVEESKDEPEIEEKTEEKPEPVENIPTKSEIIEVIKSTIRETLQELNKQEMKKSESEPKTDEELEKTKTEEGEVVEETEKEIEMALKARDEAIESFEKEIKELKEHIKELENTEEKPKTSKEPEKEYIKDTGLIVDKRHGRVYRQ